MSFIGDACIACLLSCDICYCHCYVFFVHNILWCLFKVSIIVFLESWSHTYYSAVMCFTCTCLLFLVTSHLVFHDLYSVWMVIVVVVTIVSDCSMGSWPHVFSLNCNHRPYENRITISESIIVLNKLYVLLQLMPHSSHYHCLQWLLISLWPAWCLL